MDQRKLRALMDVRRLNFERCNQYESVAEHSFFTALLAYEAAIILNVDPAKSAMEAMMHDLEEAATGDIPYLVRKQMDSSLLDRLDAQASAELSLPSRRLSKITEYCDALEFAMYLQSERQLGNTKLNDIFKETVGRLVRSTLWYALSDWTLEVLQFTDDDLPTINTWQNKIFSGLKH